MITISINGRLIDAIHALVTSLMAERPETMPEAPAVVPKADEDPRGRSHQAASAKAAEPVAAGRSRKKAGPREQVAVTSPEAQIEPIKAAESKLEPIKAAESKLEPIKAVESKLEPIKAVEATAPKAPAPVALDEDEWPATLTKPPSWDYDGHGASWRAANQIGTAELGAAIQRVYIDHADIVKMPSVRVAMSKLGVEGWWRCVAKNIAEARDASNRPLDITPKREAKND